MNARCVEEPEYIFVVGTAHFSEQSAEDVDRVIEVGSHLHESPYLLSYMLTG